MRSYVIVSDMEQSFFNSIVSFFPLSLCQRDFSVCSSQVFIIRYLRYDTGKFHFVYCLGAVYQATYGKQHHFSF